MFAKVENGQLIQYPYTDKDLRRDNPNTSFPIVVPDDIMEQFGMVKVQVLPQPMYNSQTQYLRALHPDFVDNVLVQDWVVENIGSEQISNIIRQQRNKKLQNTDWTQVEDVPENIKLAYREYRQLLRDLPQQETFPQTVAWPVEPQL